MASEHPNPSRKEREIFIGALDKPTPEGRAKYLDDACGSDLKLRASVESLLKEHQEANENAECSRPCGASQSISEQAQLEAGDKYKVLEKIGEGGLGIVYRAEQQKPFRRMVAIKTVKSGFGSKQADQRFSDELRALAALEHPFIAKIFDADRTVTGKPYFVMELVRGLKITDYADQHRLDIPMRLELFLKVCQAVQHAHSKGIVHRDLKPSNILVHGEGDESWPKVIDFGIAKILDGRLKADNDPLTRTGHLIGTPAYMSPEQASGDPHAVNESSDVYALGVVLYELLVGKLPLAVDGSSQPPSARINEQDDASYFRIAKKRGVDPAQLEKLLKGDLDRIVMRCLEKDSVKRFGSVTELLVALQNYLGSKNGGPLSSQSFKPILRGLAIGIAAVVLVGLYIKIRPDFSTPEGFIKIMCNPNARVKYDREIINRSTATGYEVWQYLKTNSYYLEKGIGSIEERPENGRRRELKMKYASSEGADEISVVFFIETNILKFHDVYICSWEGGLYSNYLSAKINDPAGFEEKIRRLNPATDPGFRSNVPTNRTAAQKTTPP